VASPDPLAYRPVDRTIVRRFPVPIPASASMDYACVPTARVAPVDRIGLSRGVPEPARRRIAGARPFGNVGCCRRVPQVPAGAHSERRADDARMFARRTLHARAVGLYPFAARRTAPELPSRERKIGKSLRTSVGIVTGGIGHSKGFDAMR